MSLVQLPSDGETSPALPTTAEVSSRQRPNWARRIAVAAGISLCLGCSDGAAPPSPEPPKVTVARPEQRDLIDYDEFFGWLEAAETVDVRARVRGHIVKVHFTDGEDVAADAPLFDLDPRPYQAEVDRATELAKVYEAERKVALNEAARQRQLFAQKVSTESDVERAEAAVQVLDAQISGAQEEIKRRQLDVDFCRIVAPIAGRISRARLTEGNLVNAGSTDPVLTTIVKIDPIKVYFFVDERTLQRYRRAHRTEENPSGRPRLKEETVEFEFGLETEAGYPHAGALDFAENRVDSSTGTIEVRGDAENADAQLVPGERVRVRVPISGSYSALVVPDSAVLSDQDKRYLLVLNAEDVVVRRDITLGRLLEDGMRVVRPPSGEGEALTAADRVVVLGLQRARINYPVTPLDDDAAPAPAAQASNP